MRRTKLSLDKSRRKILDKFFRKTGKSVGQLNSGAVDEVFCGNRALEQPLSDSDPIWNFIGSGESRKPDVSVRHDHYLYGDIG